MAGNYKEITLITGGNAGLGFEIAKKLLHDHGDRFHIIIGSRTPSKGAQAVKDLQDQGLKSCETVEIDVTNNQSVNQAAKTIEQKYGRLDVLHVNAGIAPERDSLGKLPLSDLIMNAMQTNVAGAAGTAEAFAPLLQKADNPRMIFMSSGLSSLERAHARTNANWPAYSASKAALNMVMLYFYHSYFEIKVNACSPGFRATALNNFGQGGSMKAGKAEDGANNAVRLSLLGEDGESGTHTEMVDATGEVKTVPW